MGGAESTQQPSSASIAGGGAAAVAAASQDDDQEKRFYGRAHLTRDLLLQSTEASCRTVGEMAERCTTQHKIPPERFMDAGNPCEKQCLAAMKCIGQEQGDAEELALTEPSKRLLNARLAARREAHANPGKCGVMTLEMQRCIDNEGGGKDPMLLVTADLTAEGNMKAITCFAQHLAETACGAIQRIKKNDFEMYERNKAGYAEALQALWPGPIENP